MIHFVVFGVFFAAEQTAMEAESKHTALEDSLRDNVSKESSSLLLPAILRKVLTPVQEQMKKRILDGKQKHEGRIVKCSLLCLPVRLESYWQIFFFYNL